MNDRHLFRGKRKDNGEWVVGYYCKNQFIVEDDLHVILLEGTHYTQGIEIDPVTLGQCTGLRDKNGALIFEGDIILTLKHIYSIAEFAQEGDCNGFRFRKLYSMRDNGEKILKPQWGDRYLTHMDDAVIGNRWDNPELLEVTT